MRLISAEYFGTPLIWTLLAELSNIVGYCMLIIFYDD